MRVRPLILLALLLGCAEDTTETDAMLARIAALEADVDALGARAEAGDATDATQDAELVAVQAELDAITGAVDLTDLAARVGATEADVDDHEARLAAVEGSGYATEQWVTDQGYGTDAALSALTAVVGTNTAGIGTNTADITANAAGIATNAGGVATNAGGITANAVDIATNAGGVATNAAGIATNTADVATNAAAIGTNASGISSNADDITANAADVATNATAIGTNTADVATNAAAIGTNTASVSTNATAITTNASDISTNATAITTNASDISTNATAIITNASDISTNATAITTNASDISTNADGISLLEAAADASLSGVHWALWEHVSTVQESNLTQGASGLTLATSGGAFHLGGWLSSTGLTSNRVHFVTFYVNNPTGADVTVAWTLCRSDSASLFIDGTLENTYADLDGACGAIPTFTLAPGAHTVQLRETDTNNVLEGLGITNAWITDHGLQTDYAGLSAALTTGL